MRLSFPLIVLAAALVGPPAWAQPSGSISGSAEAGVLAVRAPSALTFSLAVGPRPDAPAGLPASHVAGPRGRGAWRGAKTGFLVGLAVGAAATAALALPDSCNPGEDYVCSWHIAAALAVPFTAVTTATGAAIGAAPAQPDPLSAPVPGP